MDYNILAFAWIRDKGLNIQTMRIYGIRFFENEFKFDYIPVLDLSGRPAMYDEVSGQLFYNQGTGEFTWGELEI